MTEVYAMTPKRWLLAGSVFTALLIVFQLAYSVGHTGAIYYGRHQAIDAIERRISLDLPYLDVGNRTLNTPINASTVSAYIDRVNTFLSEHHSLVRIYSIESVSSSPLTEEFSSAVLTNLKLATPEQDVSVELAVKPLYSQWQLYPLGILAALLFTVFVSSITTQKRKAIKQAKNVPEVTDIPTPKLVINLEQKTIGNNVNERTAILQNKPLCFYTALLKYCADHPNTVLYHHQDIPAELTVIAHKVFARLMELGHTKRKRPDFNANLDKTLSEIRAALDEVFEGLNNEKALYYPPRAQGEGSRSKQHSYALTSLLQSQIEIQGLN